MNDDSQRHERPSADDEALGSALGEAVGREADSPVEPPPVADIAERAAARAKARRIRHGVVGIAAAAALIAGLVTWNTLDGDGGDGNIQVATQPTAPEPAGEAAGQPDPSTPERAEQAGDSDPTGAEGDPAAAPVAEAVREESAAPDPQPLDPPAAGPDDGMEDVDSTSTVREFDLPSPEDLSTGPTLIWIEVDCDTSTGLHDVYGMESVGDGRILAHAWGDNGDQVVITDDGTTWFPVPMPAGIYPGYGDVSGDRWLVGGQDIADPQNTGRAFFSDDEGATWTELPIALTPAASMPSYCPERSRVRSVMASGDRIVVLVDSFTDLDLAALLVERGFAPDSESIQGWDHTASALVVNLAGSPPNRVEVAHEELGLAPGQPWPCAGPDGRHDQHVHILAGDGSGIEPVGRYGGANTSAIRTVGGFYVTVRTGAGDLLLTSPDGRTWTEQAVSEQGYVPVTRGPDGAAWRSARTYDSYRIERLDAGSGPGTVVEFTGVRPGPILTAGPAGVVTTAELISRTGGDSRGEVRIVKEGYELRIDQAWGDLALWDLATDVAVYKFAAPEIMFRATAPEGIRFVTEDDGSETLVFEDPDTGDDLVAFTTADLERNAAQFSDDLGVFEPPPTWIGWSADGAGWGWQTAVDAFGIDTGPTDPSAIELAVGADFVLARVAVLDEPDQSAGPVDPDRRGPTPRWFIARVP